LIRFGPNFVEVNSSIKSLGNFKALGNFEATLNCNFERGIDEYWRACAAAARARLKSHSGSVTRPAASLKVMDELGSNVFTTI